MKKIAILGATGTIGQNCLNVIERHKNIFKPVLLTGFSNKKKLEQIATKFNVKNFSCNPDDFDKLITKSDATIVVNGISGSQGLRFSITTIKSKKILALANKETIVMGGNIILKMAENMGVKIIPVDSEHAAIFELQKIVRPTDIKKIIITASGGAFRDRPLKEFKSITLNDALKHPTWNMGRKITIDSATMANKGLEILEAKYLFNLPKDKIDVLIHPESKFHAILQTNENSFYGQFSNPNMEIPIQNALSYPDKIESNCSEIDLTTASWSFKKVDYKKYPMLKLAYECYDKNLNWSIAYNAINEVAVEKFLTGKIHFTEISKIAEKTLEKIVNENISSLEDIEKYNIYIKELTEKF